MPLTRSQLLILLDLFYGALSVDTSLTDFIKAHSKEGIHSLNLDLETLKGFLKTLPKDLSPVIRLLDQLSGRAKSKELSKYITGWHSRQLTERQKEQLSLLYKERNRTILEIAAIQSEARERGQRPDPAAFTDFSYTRMMDF